MPAALKWTDIGKPPDGFGFVYSLCDPSNPNVPRYVGQTIGSMARRLAGHKCHAKTKPDWPVSKWMSELFSKGLHPIARVLETVPIIELDAREEAWIVFFKPLGVLTNRSNGVGMKGLSGYVSPLNRKITAERNRLGCPPERRKKISEAKRGHKLSQEAKANWMATEGFKVAQEKFEAANEARKKKVVCEETGEEFESIRGAARALGIQQSHFYNSIKHGWRIRGRYWKVISVERNENVCCK